MVEEIKKDIISLAKSPFSLFILLIPMPIIALVLYLAFGSGILVKMPIGILDLDQSNTSNEIIFSLSASPNLEIQKFYTSLDDAKIDLENAKIYALLVLPHHLQNNAKKGISTSIPLYYNTQFLLVGKTLQSKILQIIGVENVKLKLAKNLVSNKVFIGALSHSVPISQQMNALYNPDSSYTQFLLTAILPCSLVILVCASMLCAITRDPRTALETSTSLKTIFITLGAKVLNNTLLYLLWWSLMMIFFTQVMDLPMRGNWEMMLLGALILILAYEAIVIFIFSLAKQTTKAISIISVYSAPSFAFAGITFPTNSMNGFARFWSDFLPISHYLELYIQQANYGGSIAHALSLSFSMTPFLLFGILGGVVYYLRIKR